MRGFQESLNRLSMGHIMKDILDSMAGMLWISQVRFTSLSLSSHCDFLSHMVGMPHRFGYGFDLSVFAVCFMMMNDDDDCRSL